VIPARDDGDHLVVDPVDQAVLLVDPPRPVASKLALEGFGFPEPGEGLTQYVED
jgi:hypothetical protein